MDILITIILSSAPDELQKQMQVMSEGTSH
jgi:hypothetical protein